MKNNYLTVTDIAEYLKLSYEKALFFIKYSGVKYVKIGRVYRVNSADLEKFLEKQKCMAK